MTQLALALVLLPVAIAVYAYIAYPLILWAMAHGAKGETAKGRSHLPTVSVVVPAYNEQGQIAGAIDALLAQDFPKSQLQILILSDASTDATDEIVSRYRAQGVELLRMPERGGKTRAENTAMPHLRGEIIVNTDASIRLHPAAVRELIAHMADPEVGVASGRDISISASETNTNVTEAGYVNYEMWVRRLESLTGGIVGASGSCYAIRSELHRIPVREDLSRDFGAALTARLHGLRSVSVDSAICFVPSTSSLRREYTRKVRTISRGMDTLNSRRELLDLSRYDLFAWKLFSHKICRWLLPIAVIPGLVGLVLAAQTEIWARWVVGGVVLLGVLAMAGALWPDGRKIPRVLSLCAFGVAGNLAVLNAVWRVIHGHEDHIWEPTRRSA